jgi:spore germination protein KC
MLFAKTIQSRMKEGKIMKKLKIFVLIFVIIANIFLISGCWNYKEINQVAIIAGCAIDKGVNKKYLVTVEIVNPKLSGPQSKIESQFFAVEGDTLFEAIRTMILKTGRKLLWSHAKVVIVSRDISKEGIIPIIDWMQRDAETRSEMWLLISKEKTAREVLEAKPKINDISSFHLDDMMRNEKSTSKYMSIDILEATRELMAHGIQTTIPVVSLDKQNGNKIASIGGTAIFKEDKLVGWLDEFETKAVVWIRGEVKGGIYEVRNVLGPGTNAVLEIFDDDSKTKAYFEDDRFHFVINIKPDVGIAEIQGQINLMEKENLEKLKSAAEEQIKNHIENVVRKAREEYQTDIFGFSSIVQRKMPKQWKEVEDNWQEAYSKAEIQVNVDLEVIGSAKLAKPVTVGD